VDNPMFWVETIISAVIAFGATFSGVYVSFKKENRRRREEVMTRLTEMNNILSDYRRHGTMESGDVTVLKIRAGKRQEVIKIMQELLEKAMTKYGAAIVADERTQEINARLKQNLQEEREQVRRTLEGR